MTAKYFAGKTVHGFQMVTSIEGRGASEFPGVAGKIVWSVELPLSKCLVWRIHGEDAPYYLN